MQRLLVGLLIMVGNGCGEQSEPHTRFPKRSSAIVKRNPFQDFRYQIPKTNIFFVFSEDEKKLEIISIEGETRNLDDYAIEKIDENTFAFAEEISSATYLPITGTVTGYFARQSEPTDYHCFRTFVYDLELKFQFGHGNFQGDLNFRCR